MKKIREFGKNIAAKWRERLAGAVLRFKTEETGASEMVVVVVLIIIVLAAATLFRQQLLNVVQNVFDRVTGWING